MLILFPIDTHAAKTINYFEKFNLNYFYLV